MLEMLKFLNYPKIKKKVAFVVAEKKKSRTIVIIIYYQIFNNLFLNQK